VARSLSRERVVASYRLNWRSPSLPPRTFVATCQLDLLPILHAEQAADSAVALVERGYDRPIAPLLRHPSFIDNARHRQFPGKAKAGSISVWKPADTSRCPFQLTLCSHNANREPAPPIHRTLIVLGKLMSRKNHGG